MSTLTARAKALQDSNEKAAQESRARQAEAAKQAQELKNAKTLSQNANTRLVAANAKVGRPIRMALVELNFDLKTQIGKMVKLYSTVKYR